MVHTRVTSLARQHEPRCRHACRSSSAGNDESGIEDLAASPLRHPYAGDLRKVIEVGVAIEEDELVLDH